MGHPWAVFASVEIWVGDVPRGQEANQGLLYEDRGVPNGVKQGQRLHRPPTPAPQDQPRPQTSCCDFPETPCTFLQEAELIKIIMIN